MKACSVANFFSFRDMSQSTGDSGQSSGSSSSDVSSLLSSMEPCFTRPVNEAQEAAARVTTNLMELMKNREFVHGSDSSDVLVHAVVKELGGALSSIQTYYKEKVGLFS